jgi:protein SCO1/2
VSPKTAVVAAAAATLAACGRGRLPTYAALPDFAMTAVGPTRDAPFTRRELRGKVWVADFVFTRCSGPCPLLSTRMASLARTLPPSVGLLTVSVDPDGDTPERLRAYAKAYGADERWVFLRGGTRQTYELLYAGFKLPMSLDAKADAGARAIHSTRLVLVDASGSIRGYYDGLSDTDADALARDARRLLEVGPS